MHVVCPSKTEIQSERDLLVQTLGHSHRQQASTGCCGHLLGLFLCSGPPELQKLQMQPSRLGQCSYLLPSAIPQHRPVLLERGSRPAD